MAALLHDIGKPRSAWINPETGYNHYYLGDEGQGANHEEVGADMTEERLKFLRYPAHRVDRIKELVNHHMWPAFNSDRGARRFLNKVGPHADDLLDLRWADQGGKSVYPTDPSLDLTAQRDLVEEARSTKAPTAISQLAIDGNDLIQSGMQPGPEMGATLQRLVEVVLEHPEYNTREKLLELANV